jgi:hypothetical protein
MAKRPSVIDSLDLDQPAPEAAAAPAPSPESAAVVQLTPAPAPTTRKARKDVQHTSVYIPMAAYDRLREIAFTERKKVHDLIMEGLDKVIKSRGHPERATRSTKAR